MKKIYKEVETCMQCPCCYSNEDDLDTCNCGAFTVRIDDELDKGFDADYKYGRDFDERYGIHRDCPFKDVEKNTEVKYLNLQNGTTYPIPGGDLGWDLLHTKRELEQEERQFLAYIIEAYCQLIHCTQKERNQTISMIRKELEKNDG